MQSAGRSFNGKNTDVSQRPIVIGHSAGGLVAQLLAAKDLISLGVPVSSVAP